MPPKQQSKADLAKKQKIIEDKTFGLKNKSKSKNVQKYVHSLHQSVQPKPDPSKIAAKKKKEEEKTKEKELNDLFKIAVSQPKVPIGVDPKSILCEFYKVGQCAKGFKCKFSHDLNVQRKGEKIDIYSDKRDQEKEKETMDDWDQETLEKIVESKRNEYKQNKPTDIVVTDSASAYVKAGEELMKKRKHLFWSPCAAHCIDNMLKDIGELNLHKETMSKARTITVYIYNHTWVLNLMREYIGGNLTRAGVTRFATEYLTLKSLAESKIELNAMFSSEEWQRSSFAKKKDGMRVRDIIVADAEFWPSVKYCLNCVVPLVKVLRLVDGDVKPAMGYIYEAMDKAKEQIAKNFNGVKRRYKVIWDIIDSRWDLQLHRPLHAAAYYLNPRFQYAPEFDADYEIMKGLYETIERMCPSPALREKVDKQRDLFRNAELMFGREMAIQMRDKKHPALWWESYGSCCKELQKLAIRILSLTCSATGCERNWSTFDQVCKYFLEAVERKQYGWFWVCPNGGKDCHYRHALPPGYVLKSQIKALIEEETEKITIEEEIENQRAKVTTSTPMTPELFMLWKKKKMEERDAGLAAQQADRAKNDRMSGRELFLSDSSLFVDDVEAYDKYQREESDVPEKKVDKNSATVGPNTSTTGARDTEVLIDDDDDDELNFDELNELEASLSRTSIQINETGTNK